MKRILLISLLFFTVTFVNAADFTSVQTGNWNSPTTWTITSGTDGDGIPDAGDVVNIANGHTVTVTANADAVSVTFTGASATLTVDAGFKLDVANAVILNSSNTINTAASITGAGTLNCDSVAVGISGSPTVNATTLITSTIANFNITGNLGLISRRTTSPTRTNNATFELQSGVLNVDGQITTSNQSAVVTSTFTMATGVQTGTLLLGNANPFSLSGTGTNTINLNGSSSTVNYDGTAQTVRNTTYNNLTLSGSGIKTAAGNLTVNGTLTTASGVTLNMVTNQLLGTLGTISNNGTIQTQNTSATPIPTGKTWGGTVEFNGGAQTVRAGTYNNLTLSGSGTKSVTANITVNNDLTVSGTASLAPNATNRISDTSKLVFNGGSYTTGGFSETMGTLTLNENSTIALGTGNHTVNFAASNGTTWVAGKTLTITGWTGSSGRIFVGTSATGLTTTQLAQIKFQVGGDVWDAVQLSTGEIVTKYCVPSSTTVRPITFVSFNEIQNTSSGTSTIASENFTSLSPANVIRGMNFTLGVRANTGGDNTHYLMVYLDWNQDGDFADAGENLQIGTIKNSNGTENNKLASVYFPVPSTATIGLTRMRIISSSTAYSATDGCSINTGTDGQAEDYLINIIDSCSGTPAPGATVASVNPVCPNVPFTLNFTNQVLNGIQYVWESSSDGSSWSGATSNPITFFATDFSSAPADSNVYENPVQIPPTPPNTTITGGELILTPATGSLLGGFKIQKTLASAGLPSINAFTTKFKFRAFDGSGADGISLSYGASLGNNAGPGEEGEGSGLRLCLDTYDNDGTGTGSRVRIYYNNSFIFQNRIGSYDLRTAAYREVVLSVSNSGFLTLTIGGTTIVSGLSLPSYTAADKSNWNFKFSARTGGENDKQSIDDIDIKYLDILTSNVLFTTQQTVATYYRVRATCSNGGAIGYSTPLLVTVDPVAPIIGTITQPTCALATGSVALSGLPSSGSWTITATPATIGLTGLTGTNVDNTNIGGLTANTSYTFVVSNVTCSSIASAAAVVNAIPTTATWNGAWTGTTPAGSNPLLTQPIVFNGDYTSTGDINGCSCTVTSGNVVINSGHTMTITNAVNVTNNATTSLVFKDQSSLVQTTNVTNTGAIEYRRKSAAMKNFDYTYWSSPVTGQNIVALSPNTLADKYFRFSGSADDWEFYNGTMVPGVGYIIRVPKPNFWPNPAATTWEQPVAFVGVPNNGDYSFSAGAGEFNLIGNPYPSAIDADSFINTNGIINGALYFWTHNTAITNNEYTADDYASYTLTGGTGTGGVGNFVDANNNGIMDPVEEVVSNRPLGKIAAGQSFFVENAAAGSFQFTNAMRVAGNNSQFFKQANTKKTAVLEKNRVWLNLTNSKGAFKQLLLGYITGATNDWDNLYDGPTFDGQEFVDFYSVNQGKNLTIQGRALPFVDTDVVPLGYRSTIAGSFDISIDNRDGSLAGQEIWLEDKKTNTLHELSKGKYTFTAINGVENDRFVLKYTGKTLGTDDNEVADKSLIVSVKNKKITLTSSAEAITQVQMFDLLGRKVYDKSKINAQEWSISNLPSSEQTLIVKTTLANGAISNKKIIY